MASRTYLPTLLAILKGLCGFITLHRDRILEVIGSSNAAALDAIVTACMVFTAVALPFLEEGV